MRLKPLRRRLPRVGLVLLFSPIVLSIAAWPFVSWQQGSVLEAGLFAEAGVLGAAGLLGLRGQRASRPAESFDEWDLRAHPLLLRLSLVPVCVVGLAWSARDVADWLVPADQVRVEIEDTYQTIGQSPHTDIWTADGGSYRGPVMRSLSAHPGSARLYLGHFSRLVLKVVQPADAIDPPPPAATPAPLPSGLEPTSLSSPVFAPSEEGGTFYEPGHVATYWYQGGSTLVVVIAGYDSAEPPPICIKTLLLVDGVETAVSFSETTPGLCRGTRKARNALLCPGSPPFLVVYTTIEPGTPGMLYGEIDAAYGKFVGFVRIDTTGSDAPPLNLAGQRCF